MALFRLKSVSRLLAAASMLLLTAASGASQTDPNPNSPTPVLLSEYNSTRALARDAAVQTDALPTERDRAFAPNSRINLYVTNISLIKREWANAFRVIVEDIAGRQYRYPVVDIREIPSDGPSVFELTVELRDEVGYWPALQAEGDVLVAVTWRGLSSNRVLLGIGKTGGNIKNEGAVPTPLDSARKKGPVSRGQQPTSEAIGYIWSGDRMRFLQQATFGSTPALDFRVRRIGIRTYLAEQFEAPYPSASNPYPNIPLKNTDAGNATNGCGMFAQGTAEQRICVRDHYTMYPVQTWFFREAFYGDAQLRHRVAWALSQIWVISGVDTQQSSHMIAYHKILSQHAFGNYRALMKDMTLNPGMGNYLDMVRSTRTNPNENYPREILQLFSIGLFMLNEDGTVMRDGQGNVIPSYDQETVNNFTKVFTGFGFCNLTCPNSAPGLVNYKDPMILNQNNHDITAKTLLSYPGAPNVNIPPNTNGNTELDMALDNIFYHPNVPPFVSRQLIQHLVTSDPTPAYVGRVAKVFANNGSGVRGDMKSVIRAILLDPEARGDIKTDPNYGKLREPVQLITNFLKAFNVRSADGAQLSDGAVQNLSTGLAQNVFNAPTVFNYYSPDYIIPGTALNGPEFGILTTGTSIARANFINTMTFGRVAVGENSPLGTSVDLSEMQSLATSDPSGNLLLDTLNQRLLHNRMSSEMRSKILPAFTAVASTNPLGRAQAAIYLVGTSSQFQIQR